MAKRFKLRLSFRSFQFCRSKQLSTLPQNPAPATYRFSPVNPKAFDIAYPTIPEPPSSTPNHPLFRSHVSPAKTVPIDSQIQSKSCLWHNAYQCNTKSSPEQNLEDHTKTQLNKLYSSPVSDFSDSDMWPVKLPKAGRQKKESGKKKNDMEKKAGGSVCRSTSSADSHWFSTQGSDYIEETESIISSRSFDSSNDFGYSIGSVSERPVKEYRRKKKKKKSKAWRVKRDASKSWRTKTTSPEYASAASKSVSKRVMPCTVDGKVKESFTVVKRSEDPHKDFKRSMLEMIVEKQMFDVKDLEQLLQCFLSLNSQHHHEAIVRAFAEVWEILFCDSPNSRHSSMGH